MLSNIRTHYGAMFKLKGLIHLSSLVINHTIPSSYFKCTVTLIGRYHVKTYSNFKGKEVLFGSRYHPGSAIERAEEKIKDYLSKTSPHTTEEWDEVKNEIMNELGIISEFNFGTILMNCLLHSNRLEEAHSLMKYLKEVNMEPNHLTLLKYMAICGRNVEKCGQEIILETFQKVKLFIEAAPVLDKTRAEHIFQGICATDKWFLALEYLKKIPGNPSTELKNCIAAAAVRNNDEKLAWEVINKWLRPEDVPSFRVFKEFLLHALKLQSTEPKKSELFLMKFFQYIHQKGVVINQETVQLIEEYFRGHSSKWNISYSKVSRNGECNSCNKSLELMDLSAEDFTCLRNSFLERSLKKSDLFINTTQREFDLFIKFIDSQKPFHMVLDGLNVAHITIGANANHGFPGSRSYNSLAQQLLKVVENLSKPSQKMLVLGRRHMLQWPRHIMRKISQKAKFFLTSNISQDDPFMVYAALNSGPNSYIVSSDLMRDHISRLDDPKLIALFKRWQQARQIFVSIDETKNIKYLEPLRHSINIQGNMEEGWHIPFDDKIILDTYEELNNWLCVQKTL